MSVSVWADISLIWLLSLALVSILPIVAILVFAIKGMRRVNELARQYLPMVGDKAEMLADKTAEVCDKIANPMIKTYSTAARIRGVTKAILRRND